MPPDEGGTQAAVRSYLVRHPDIANAEFYASARVVDVSLCAMTTVGNNPGYVCPVAFENEQGERMRAFADLTPQFLFGWKVERFDPIERVDE